MEADADRVAEATFRIYQQLITGNYYDPNVAQLASSIGRSPDPKLALYVASRLIKATAQSLNVSGGAVIWAQQKLLEKVERYHS